MTETTTGNAEMQRAAERYMRAGFSVIPVPSDRKGPNDRPEWQHERWTVEDIPKQWNNGQNVGLLLGAPSKGIIDVDLDEPETQRIAGRFLPPTKTSGRASAPDSHWWYYSEVESRDFTDRGGVKILEIRSTGRQTLVHPSVHPDTGERYCWSDNGLDTERIPAGALLRGCRELATAGLIARSIPPAGSGRHDIALALAGFMLPRLEAEAVERIMLAAWDAAGYPDARARREGERDLRASIKDTAARQEEGRQATGGGKLDQLLPGLPRKISDYWGWNLSSKANGKGTLGLVKRLSDAILEEESFAQDQGQKLYHFSGGTYRQYAERYIRRRVKELLEDWGESDKWSSHRANEVVEYIRADAPELWERPPRDEINLVNGILNVETRELREHDPGFLSPVQIPVRYDPRAQCPAWDKFISEVFPEDAQDLAFELAADLITPSRSAQKAILLLGEGSNGKSTCLRALTAFVGSPNASGTSLHKLESDRFSTARLIGKLANICPDLPSAHLAETSVFKAITGGDDLHAEYKYRESFEFRPYCRLVFSANHVPRSGDASHAFFRRWLVVPFNRTFEPDEQIPREVLDSKLADAGELSGVLNRALAVIDRVRTEGFTESRSMLEAWEEFKAMTDPVSVWLSQNTVESAEAFVPKGELLRAYNDDCDEKGRSGMTATAFGLAIKRARPGIEDAQRVVNGKYGVKVWLGIGLRGGGEDPPEDDPPGGGDDPVNPVNPVNPVSLIVSDFKAGELREEGEARSNNRENPVNPVNPVNPDAGEPLTADEVQEYRRLVSEGMKRELARAAVLRKRRSP